jgi:hypothetical protein
MRRYSQSLHADPSQATLLFLVNSAIRLSISWPDRDRLRLDVDEVFIVTSGTSIVLEYETVDRALGAVLAGVAAISDNTLAMLLAGAMVVGGGVLHKVGEKAKRQFAVDRSEGGGGSEGRQEFTTELSLSILTSGPLKDLAPPLPSDQAVCFSAFSASCLIFSTDIALRCRTSTTKTSEVSGGHG